MKNSKRKHFLLILLIILIAIFSMQYMMKKADTGKKDVVAVVLPKDNEVNYSRLMDGIRDYAMNNDILLDVWYEDNIFLRELEDLIAEEEKNHAAAILLVYPEKYMNSDDMEKGEYDNVLAITDTMTNFFSNTASFEENNGDSYSIPVPVEVIKRVEEEKDWGIYIKNTYKLGYCSMDMIDKYAQNGRMEDICLKCMKVDKTTITNGNIDALLID